MGTGSPKKSRQCKDPGNDMKTFLLACVAAIVIATVAGFALNAVQKPAEQAYSTTGVRL